MYNRETLYARIPTEEEALHALRSGAVNRKQKRIFNRGRKVAARQKREGTWRHTDSFVRQMMIIQSADPLKKYMDGVMAVRSRHFGIGMSDAIHRLLGNIGIAMESIGKAFAQSWKEFNEKRQMPERAAGCIISDKSLHDSIVASARGDVKTAYTKLQLITGKNAP